MHGGVVSLQVSGHFTCRATGSHIDHVFTTSSLVKPTRLEEEQRQSDLRRTRSHDQQSNDTTVIPVMQEELDVSTRRVETQSGVRVSKTVEERDELIDEPLTKEEVEVERVPMNVPVDAASAVRYEGDTMIIPIFEEVVVVEKRLVLKEEIRVTRRKTDFRAPQRVRLRREHADVERIEDARPDRKTAVSSGGDSLIDAKRQEQEELRRR
jgi:uncharacterized protein (TIGR02271 family)